MNRDKKEKKKSKPAYIHSPQLRSLFANQIYVLDDSQRDVPVGKLGHTNNIALEDTKEQLDWQLWTVIESVREHRKLQTE